MTMSLLGLDIGSTGCKAVAFNAEGQVLASAYREYAEVYPAPGWIELRPEEMWEAILTVLQEVAAQVRHDPPQALSISALGEAFTPLDRHGRPLYNTIVSPDTRAWRQAESWHERLGAWRVFQITGMPLHSSFTLNKIMWMRDERPEVHRQVWKYLLWPDLVFYRLGLEPRLDWSLAGRTMAFDVVNKCWSEEICAAADLSPELFATPIRPGEMVGELSPKAAELTGLPAGCLVVAGGHDQPMNALGAGVIREGMAVDGMGTVECITVAFNAPVLTETMLANNYCCYPHVYDDMYASLAFNYSAGSILRWYRDHFGRWHREQAAARGCDVYDLLLSDLPEGPTGLLLVPYFAGSGTPYLDALSRGALLGLSLHVDEKTFVKGLLEGICYEMRLNIERLAEAGVVIDRLRCTGGGAKSPVWLQLKADILGKPAVTINVTESGCQAGALLGGVAAGVYASAAEAVAQVVRERQVFEPRPDLHARYQEFYALYREVWPTIRDLTHRLSVLLGA
jgi:xylulokinase